MPQIVFQHDGGDIARVQAVMFFPHDEKLREQLLVYCQAEAARLNQGGRVVVIDAEILERLGEAPSHDEFKRLEHKSQRGGCTAGDMLTTLYLMHKFKLPEPSMNRAIFVARAFAKGKTYSDGKALEFSKTEIIAKWREFKSVAHLWGAMRFLHLNRWSFYAPEVFPTFLMLAAGLFEFGGSFIPKRARPQKPILDAATSWTLPGEIIPKYLNFDTPPDFLIKTLKRYKPPVRSVAKLDG